MFLNVVTHWDNVSMTNAIYMRVLLFSSNARLFFMFNVHCIFDGINRLWAFLVLSVFRSYLRFATINAYIWSEHFCFYPFDCFCSRKIFKLTAQPNTKEETKKIQSKQMWIFARLKSTHTKKTTWMGIK